MNSSIADQKLWYSVFRKGFSFILILHWCDSVSSLYPNSDHCNDHLCIFAMVFLRISKLLTTEPVPQGWPVIVLLNLKTCGPFYSADRQLNFKGLSQHQRRCSEPHHASIIHHCRKKTGHALSRSASAKWLFSYQSWHADADMNH